MSAISSWSTAAASNNSVSPDGFPENMAASGVNNSAREVMASVRTWYEDVEWRNFGHTVTRTGNTTFTIASDVTTTYVTDRQIRCADSSTLYGYIVSSSYSAPNTTVTVALDSGNLSSSLTSVAIGYIPSKKSVSIKSLRNPSSTLYPGEWTTFTPTVTLVGGSGNTVPQYSTNSGRYSLVGKTVSVQILLSGDGGNEGAGTGAFTVALPLTSGASCNTVVTGHAANGTARFIIQASLGQSVTTVSFNYYDTIATLATFTGALQNNTTRSIQLSFTYEID